MTVAASHDNVPLERDAEVLVPLGDLRHGLSPRLRAPDVDHARALAESFEHLPPIAVHRASMMIIDGEHRLLAGRILHVTVMRALLIDCSESAAVEMSVRLNSKHGKPLSLREREAAAESLLEAEPAWSDRRIAHACGLSPTTIGRIRQRAGRHTVKRVGRDGRTRDLGSARSGATADKRPSTPVGAGSGKLGTAEAAHSAHVSFVERFGGPQRVLDLVTEVSAARRAELLSFATTMAEAWCLVARSVSNCFDQTPVDCPSGHSFTAIVLEPEPLQRQGNQ